MKTKNDIIRLKRIERKLSQELIADKIGISQSNYSKLENGEKSFSVSELSVICEILEVSPLDVLDFSNKEQIFINSSNSGNHNSTINMSETELKSIINQIVDEKFKNINDLIIKLFNNKSNEK
jgi:transcriptional regulator with XRE-family HTH domain